MITVKPTRYPVPHPARAGATADITTIALAALDMAFVLDQSATNLIVSSNALTPQLFTIATETVSYSGMLNPTAGTTPVSLGSVGQAVGSGVFVSMELGGSATVNGNSYSGPIPMMVIPNAFSTQEQGLNLSQAAQGQLTFLTSTYGSYFESSYWGLDFGDNPYIPDQPAPTGWAANDWTTFCSAVQAQLIATPISPSQVTLMQGVVPSGSNQWNFGPTTWCCFNVPPLDGTCSPALVFGFMVSDHPLPTVQAFTGDFAGVQLFNASGGASAMLIASSGIVVGDILPLLMPSSDLQQIAGYGVTFQNIENGDSAIAFEITANTVTPTTTSGYLVGYAGSKMTEGYWSNGFQADTGEATTATVAGVAFTAPENGLYQQVTASGSFTVSGFSMSQQIPAWNISVPQAVFAWTTSAVMQVSSTGVVSFGSITSSFPNTPETSSPGYDWWMNPGTYGAVLIGSAWNWGTTAQGVIGPVFCPSTNINSQLNMFAFPGGAMYDAAVGGINQSNNMILNLSYNLP